VEHDSGRPPSKPTPIINMLALKSQCLEVACSGQDRGPSWLRIHLEEASSFQILGHRPFAGNFVRILSRSWSSTMKSSDWYAYSVTDDPWSIPISSRTAPYPKTACDALARTLPSGHDHQFWPYLECGPIYNSLLHVFISSLASRDFLPYYKYLLTYRIAVLVMLLLIRKTRWHFKSARQTKPYNTLGRSGCPVQPLLAANVAFIGGEAWPPPCESPMVLHQK